MNSSDGCVGKISGNGSRYEKNIISWFGAYYRKTAIGKECINK